MNHTEFSNEFDILYNNIMSNAAPGLSEYDKSVLLTKAQEELVISIYTGRNTLGIGFEIVEESRRYLDVLVKTVTITDKLIGKKGVSPSSIFYSIPDDVWFITYEAATLSSPELKCSDKEAAVIPTLQDDYFRVKDNPYRGPSKDRVLRLDSEGNIAELISKYSVDSYLLRYLRKPSPIILADLSEYNVTINGISTITECELNTALHNLILEYAVKMAKAMYQGDIQAD